MSLWWWLLLVLWPFSGLIGWAWMNYSAFMHNGDPCTTGESVLWRAFQVLSPFLGPILLVANLCVSISLRRFYWGLRFR